jgi:hypothetical protein
MTLTSKSSQLGNYQEQISLKLSGASTVKGVFKSSIKQPMLMLDGNGTSLMPFGMMNTTRHEP